MRARSVAGLACVCLAVTAAPAFAASLQASPVTIEIHSPATTSSVTLRNEADKPLNAQIRVFRWTQADGKDQLEPTTDVVASPPMATLMPNADYVVRLVRLSKQPINQEETYRILVDEIPDTNLVKSGVNIAMRYSIPIFVEPKQLEGAKLTWETKSINGRFVLAAVNNGDRRVRISELKATDASGATVSFGNGLNGYVLARSATQWTAPSNAAKMSSAGPVTINAKGDTGPINAKANNEAGR